MKFLKEDILKVYKTNPIEESLLVFQSEGNTNQYIEYAIVKIEGYRLTESDIRYWIDSIDRLKDCYLFEYETPLRIRLRNSFYPIWMSKKDESLTVDAVADYLANILMPFDVQKPPLYRVEIIETPECQFFCLIYHHLLFDGISVQLALSNLDRTKQLSFSDWNPIRKDITILKQEIKPFLLEGYVPPTNQNKEGYYRQEFSLAGISYETVMREWVNYLRMISGQEEVVIGEVFSARDSSLDAATALGYFVQAWPLVFHGEVTEVKLKEVRSQIISISDGYIKDYFSQNSFDQCWVVEPFLNTEFETSFYSTPHYLLTIIFKPKGDALSITFCWNLLKIDQVAAMEIGKGFIASLEKENDLNLSENKFELVDQSLLDRWDEVVEKNPNKIAVEDVLGQKLTYTEIDHLANNLASQLAIDKDDCVGVYSSYSANIPIAFLAILKKGGIYVPLDPTVSEERRNFIVDNSHIKTVISDLPNSFDLAVIHPIQASPNQAFKPLVSSGNDTCYLIYTSGTTGVPKGCAVSHSNLLNLFIGTQSCFNFKNSDRWILAHSYGFDFSTWEIWGALLMGATLYIPDRKEVQDTFKFHQILIDKEINILNQTPKSFYNLMLVDEGLRSLNHIDYVIFGGDKLKTELLSDWVKSYPRMQLINMYGITETTVHVTYKKIVIEGQSNLGIPLPGYSIQLKNKAGKSIPNGFVGEIYVYGRGVCNGYFENAELSEEKFGSELGQRFYRSGDLCWKIGSEFYYLGRRDRQVKVRGFRIELGEIEFSLKKHTPNCNFIVLYHQEKLLAFFNGSTSHIDPNMYRGMMADYAIPSSFIYVDSFPLNQSGKIDEKSLLATQNKQIQATKPAENGAQLIYQEILGNQFDYKKSFIQNGGDSIIAIRLISKFKKEGWNLSIQDLFSALPLDELSIIKTSTDSVEGINHLKLFHQKNDFPFVNDHFFFPLLEAQEGILIDCLKSEIGSMYVEQLTYEIQGNYSASQIEAAYRQVCKKNPLLLAKIIRKNADYLFEVNINTQANCTINSEDNIDLFIGRDFNEGFDIMENLSRLTIFPGTDSHQLVWTHHHLLLDGWSLGVFSQLMINALENREINYADGFIQKSCAHVLSSNSSDYWKERTKNKTLEPIIPHRSSRIMEDEYQKDNFKIVFNSWDELKKENISPHSFILSAWSAFLGVFFSNNELVLGNVISLRDEASMEELGMFIRTLPFEIKLNPSETFLTYVKRVFNQLRMDDVHREDPINVYLKEDHLNHLFVYENYPVDHTILAEKGVKIGRFQERTGAKWSTIVYPLLDGFELSILYDTRSYSKIYTEQILFHFKKWFEQLTFDTKLADSLGPLDREKSILGHKEIHLEKNILQVLKRSSTSLAIISKKKSITYQTLWEEANSLSKRLEIEKGEAVGIDVSSTYHFTISILAIWLSEGVACPVDKRYPNKRKDFVYKNSGIKTVIFSFEDEIKLIYLSNETQIHSFDASFILHTSGSTGQPKGVIQTHKCLVNLIKWNSGAFGMDQNQIVLQLSSFGFDASFHEVLLTLSLGGTLVEVPLEDRQDIHQIKEYIIEFQATLAWIPARLLNAILEADQLFFSPCKSINHIVTTGEALVVGSELKGYLQKSFVKLLNYYGPTETHVVTATELIFDTIITQPSIGTPLINTEIILYNERGYVYKGMIGELLIAGDNLALGYLNDPVLTAERFILLEDKVFYKTGDWAYLDDQGKFHFIGRKDDQLKIRGFRVEPIEIERSLAETAGISQCCIIVVEQKLFAFIVTELNEEQLIRRAQEALPDYMVPARFIILDSLPINENGKADRAALRLYLQSNQEQDGLLDKTKISVRCWIEILGHEHFSGNDGFEHVGGNSILLMKMQAWLEKNTGCFVSVKSLLLNNTPELLEGLIHQKLKESNTIFPETLPLNSMQRGILITELGNDFGLDSPFILSFKVLLKSPTPLEKWKEGILQLIKRFPYLAFTLDQIERPAETTWKKGFDQEQIFTSFNEEGFLTAPLIRFIYHDSNSIELIWHHILLDGLGLSVLLNNLMEILQNPKLEKGYSIDPLLSYNLVYPNILIQTVNTKARVKHCCFEKDTMERVEQFCREKNIEVSSFCYFSVAKSHHAKHVAVADIKNHPGIPGMFTELSPITFDLDKAEIEPILTSTAENPISIVINFMLTETPENWVEKLEVSYPSITKYPFEWQFIQFNDRLEVSFYFGENDFNAEKIFEDWLIKWENILSEKAFETERKNDNLFEDFDF